MNPVTGVWSPVQQIFRQALNVQLVPVKEMQSVVDGLIFLSNFGDVDEVCAAKAPRALAPPLPRTV